MIGIFLDIETNGLNPFKHKVLEIAFCLIDVETGKELDSYTSMVYQPKSIWNSSDKESLKINGLSFQEVEKGQSEENVKNDILYCFKKHGIQRGKSVFICQNPSFDRPFFAQIIEPEEQERLLWPYHWLDLASMHWSRALERNKHCKGDLPWELGLSKDKIAKAYKLDSEETPHRAINGVHHLIECYRAVVGFNSSHHRS